MPTGYTYPVQEGKITEFRPFALQCARAFGALIEMGDDPMDTPIPAKFEPNTSYHDERLADANDVLMRVPAMTDAECDAAAQKEYGERLASWTKRREERALHRQRYEDMLAKVAAWHAPEACEGLKSFMTEQLTLSIGQDCEGRWDDEPQPQTGTQWRAAQLKEATRDVEYHGRERAEAIARCAGRNHWLDALRASLIEAP